MRSICFLVTLALSITAAIADSGSRAPNDFVIAGKTRVGKIFTDHRVAAVVAAACTGNVGTVESQIRDGVDPNSRGAEGTTPLMWVILCENADGVDALLKLGANPNYHSPRLPGNMMHGGDIPPTGGDSPVFLAADTNNPAVLNAVLRHGGDPNDEEVGSNRTALCRAFERGARYGHWANYYALLRAGADINREYGHKTIANCAIDAGRFDKVAELLNDGYNLKLDELVRAVKARILVPPDPQIAWQQKVTEMLKQRGVSQNG